MIAVVPVRDGHLPHGGDAAIRACAGRTLLVGEGTASALREARVDVVEARRWEAGAFAPARWSAGLSSLLADEPHVVLPGCPDGRDLLGRLAHALGRTPVAWCTAVSETELVTTRHDGAASVVLAVLGPYVATLVPSPVGTGLGTTAAIATEVRPGGAIDAADAEVLGVDAADPRELDLADADRIAAGGVGLGGREAFAELEVVATALGASLGATRPVADRGVVGHERQIGTTGVTVDPTLYLAFGISGAVQHTAGLGSPRRVVAVNTDPACPMMAMADLAVVADAAATVHALRLRLADEGT